MVCTWPKWACGRVVEMGVWFRGRSGRVVVVFRWACGRLVEVGMWSCCGGCHWVCVMEAGVWLHCRRVCVVILLGCMWLFC